MSILDQVITNADNVDAPVVDIPQQPEIATTTSAGGEAEITSIKTHANLLDNPEQVAKADRIQDAVMPQTEKQKLDTLLNEMNPDNAGHYKHPRYYALTGGRSGGQLFIKNPKTGRPETVTFPKGLYATTEKRIVDAIDNGIKRSQNNIGHMVQNISHRHYKEKQDAANAYQRMLSDSGHGMTSSNDVNAHAIERAAKAEALQNTVNEQQAKIDELERKLAKTHHNSAPVKEQNPAITASTGKPIPPVAQQQEQLMQPNNSLSGILGNQ